MSALAAVIWDWWWLLALAGALALLWVVLRWHDTTPDPTATAPEGPATEPAPAGPAPEQIAAAALTPDDPALPDVADLGRSVTVLDQVVDRHAYWVIAAHRYHLDADALGRLAIEAYAPLDGLPRGELYRLLALAVGGRVADRVAEILAGADRLDPAQFHTTERTDR